MAAILGALKIATWRWLLACLAIVLLLNSTAKAEVLRLAVSTPAVTKGDPFERYTGGSVKSAVFDGLTQISLAGEVTAALAVEAVRSRIALASAD